MSVRIGSLFSGGGGLDIAVESVFGGRVTWQAEVDPAASKVLAYRFPDVPNLGDVTLVDWTVVEWVEVLCLGFPCQDVSPAGRRAGIRKGTRSGLWSIAAEAIAAIRPAYVVIENVRGLLSAKAHRTVESDNTTMGDGTGGPVLRAAGAVCGDLAELRYDTQWVTVAASDVDSCHERKRVIFLATDTTRVGRHEGWSQSTGLVGRSDAAIGSAADVALLPTPRAADHKGSMVAPAAGRHVADGYGTLPEVLGVHLLPTPMARDHKGAGPADMNRNSPAMSAIADLIPAGQNWGKYGPAIHRWEAITRPAPSPTEPNTRGKPRLSPAFSEWMQGWPAGWVTAVPGLGRNDQLRIIGNGVCPQQAEYALQQLIPLSEVAA